MPNVVGEMVVRVGTDTTQLQKGLAQGQKQMSSFVQTMGQMGRKMTMGFTLPVAGVGVAATKMAMDFESQMTDVFTLMDDATIASRDWSKEVLDMSKTVPQGTDVLSKGLYDIISAGIDAGSAMDVLGVSSKAATAGLSDTATAVSAITAVLNAYGLEASEANNVADTLFTTVKKGVTTFPELASSIGRVISTASAANISFDEVGIALATMTQSGLSTDEAVVALNQTILSFLKPGSEAQKVAEKIGFRFDAVTLATEGLGGTLSGLQEKLNITVDELVELEEAGMTDAEMWDEMATRMGLTSTEVAKLFPNIRALKGFLALTREDMEAYNENAEAMADKTGSMMSAFEKQSKTAKFQWDLTMSSLKAAGIEIGNIVMPQVMKLVEWIGKMADKFGELPEPIKTAIVTGTVIAAIVPPILWATSSIAGMITKIKGLRTASIGASAAARGLATGIGAGGTAAASAAGPLAAAAAAMAAIAYGGHKAYTAMGDWVTQVDKSNRSGRMFRETLQAIVGVMSGGIWTTMVDRFKEISLIFQLSRDEGIGFFKAWREYSHWTTEELKDYVGVSEDVVDVEEQRAEALQGNLKILSDYALAHEELRPILHDLEQLYNDGSISLEGYEQAVQHILDQGPDMQGIFGQEITNGTELAASMGILSDDYYAAAEARQAAAEASEDHAAAMDNERQSMQDLMAVMFQQYNMNASIVEQIWGYQDAQARLNEVLKESGRDSREYAEAYLSVERAGQQIINSFAEQISQNQELDASTQTLIDSYQSIRNAVMHVGLQMVQTGSITFGQLEDWASHAGITSGEIIDYWHQVADEFGTIPAFAEIDIIANDLASDQIETIVGRANEAGESVSEIDVAIEEASKKEVNQDLEQWTGHPLGLYMTMDTEEAGETTEGFIVGPWGAVESEIDVDTSEAEKTVKDFIGRDWGEIKIGVGLEGGFDYGAHAEMGKHMPGYAGGGLIQARDGLNLGGSGARPVMIHPPELVLNKDQALNALWNMANGGMVSGSRKMDLSGKINIQVDGEGAQHLNESLLSDIITGRIIKEIKEEGARK